MGNWSRCLKTNSKAKPVIGHCRYAIRNHLEQVKYNQEKNKALLGSDYNYEYDGYICVTSTGNLLQPDYITETFAKLLKKHKLKKIRFHGLRHSCATLLLNLGFSMKEIQVWLGHS